MAQTLLVCWRERRDDVELLSKPAASLGWTSVSNPIYSPLLAKGLLCGLCQIALTAVTGQCAAKPVPD